MTAVSLDPLAPPGQQVGARPLSVLRIRLGDAGLVSVLSNHLTRMGFNTATVADDTIEVTPISPVSADYDACTMQAYFHAWHERHSDVEAELSG